MKPLSFIPAPQIILPLILLPFCVCQNTRIPIKYSSPICASTGGSATLSCLGSYAVYDIFVGRDTEGACSWTEDSPLDCSVDYTYSQQVIDMMNIVFTKVKDCNPPSCQITGIPPIETDCDDDAFIRIAYFCYTDSIISENGGSLTQRSGCNSIVEERDVNGNEIIFKCSETSHRVNLLFLSTKYYVKSNPQQDITDTCDLNPVCTLAYRTNSAWINVHEECLKYRNCPISALGNSNGVLYGCDSLQVSATEVEDYSYKYICQNPSNFTINAYELPEDDNCIGMSDGLHALIADGRFDNNICFRSYTDCLGGTVKAKQSCAAGQGFYEATQACRRLDSEFCSIATPELFAESLSATEIKAIWTIEDNPDSYNLTIRSVNPASFLQSLDSLDTKEHTFNQLTPNTNYSLSIVALKQNFESEVSLAWNVTYPENPSGSASNIGTDQATINWNYGFTATSIEISIEPVIDPPPTNSFPLSDGRTSTIVDNLEGGTEYTVTLTLVGMSGLKSLEPFEFKFLTKPIAPTNLTASEITETSIKFTWNQTGRSEGWRYSIVPGPISGGISSGEGPQLNLDDLEGGTQYEITVLNFVANIESETIATKDSTIPFAPVYSKVDPEYNSVNIEWQHTEGRADSYSVSVELKADSQQSASSETSNKQIEMSNLTCGSIYTISLTASSYGKSSTAVISNFTTLPEAPETLDVTNFSTNSASLEWSSVDNCNVEQYQLEWSDDGQAKQQKITAPTTSADLSSLYPGRTYTFEIRSVVFNHEGNPLLSTSNPRQTVFVQTLIPLPPENFKIDIYGSASMTLSWSKPSASDFTGFEIEYTVSSTAKTILVGKTNNDEYQQTISKLTPGSLQEVDITTISQGSDEKRISTKVTLLQRLKPNPPANFRMISRTTTSTTVSFNAPIGEYSSFTFQAKPSESTAALLANETILKESSESVYNKSVGGAIQGDQITFTIFSQSGDEQSEVSEKGTVNLCPADPVNFTITDSTTTTLEVSWDSPPGFYGGHKIEWMRLDINEEIEEENVPKENSAKIFDSLIPGARYNVEIWTLSNFDSTLHSKNSRVVIQVLKPNPPIDLGFDPIDKTSLNLTWSVIGLYHGFKISYDSESVDTRQFFEQINGLSPATNYTFEIKTAMTVNIDPDVESDPSTIVGYTYPDDITDLVCEASLSQVITVSVNWSLAVVSYDSFEITLTSIPYDNENELTRTLVLTQAVKGTDSPFTHQFTSSDVSWLVPGLKISCSAVAVYLDLKSQTVAADEFYVPPIAPDLSYVEDSRTTNSLGLSWAFTVDNAIAEAYEIEYNVEPNSDSNPAETLKVTSKFNETISALRPGQKYTFRIRSSVDNETVFSDWSNSVEEPTFPEVPVDAKINFPNVSWSSPSTGAVESYEVQVEDNDGNNAKQRSTNLSISTNDFTNFNFVPGRKYTFSIFAISNDLYSQNSAKVEYVVPPNDVDFITIDDTSSSSVSLSWTIPDGDVDKYILKVTPFTQGDEVEGYDTPIDIPDKNSNTRDLPNLTPGAEYRFEIVASSNNVPSENPGVRDFRMKPLLTTTEISALSESGALCSWKYEGFVDTFSVSLRDTQSNLINGSSFEKLETELSHEFTGLTAGETYTCSVVATSGNSDSDSKQARFTTYPFTPVVEITYNGTRNLSAEWSVQDGGVVDSFKVVLSKCSSEVREETVSSSILSKDWEDLIPGTECQVDVWSIRNNQQSRSKGTATQKLRPATPVLTQTGSTTSSVTISWQQEGSATQFKLQRDDTGEKLYSGSVRSVTLNNLEPFSLYPITLDAYNGALRNWVSAQITVGTSPAPVTGAKVQPISDTQLLVTWDMVDSNANQQVTYIITRIPLENVTETTTVNRVGVSQNKFEDSSLIPGTDYTYEIVSNYSGGESVGVQTSGYTYPATPSRILTENMLNDATGLRWITTQNYDSFIVNVEGLNDSYERTFILTEDRVYLEGLDPGQKYRVDVQSRYKELVSQSTARMVFQTACYPIGTDMSKPWIVAFWITFIYAVVITVLCIFLGYFVYNGSVVVTVSASTKKNPEPVKPVQRYLISASPLDGTKWQKTYPPVFCENPIYNS